MVSKKILGTTLGELKKLFSLIALVVIAGSCTSYYPVTIEVLQPAAIMLPGNPRSLTIVNASFVDSPIPISDPFLAANYMLDTLAAQKTSDAIGYFLTQSPLIENVTRQEEMYMRSAQEIGRPLSDSVIKAYCLRDETQALLALNAFNVDYKLETKSMSYGSENYSWQECSFITNLRYGIYPANGSESKEWLFTDTIYIGEYPNRDKFEESVKKAVFREELSNEIATRCGSQISDKLAPYWQDETRMILVPNITDFKIAANWATSGNWEKARNIWEKYSGIDKGKFSAMACYNMAVSFEANGSIDSALYYIESASAKHTLTEIIDYKKQLQLRKEKEELLDKQFSTE